MDKKNQQSKAKFGTLTATSDTNNDYSQDQSSKSSYATSSMQDYGTMTAEFDANDDSGSKAGSQNKGSSNNQQQANSKKPQTSDKNTGH